MSLSSRIVVLLLASFFVFTTACTKKEDRDQNFSPIENADPLKAAAPQEKPIERCEAHSRCSDFRDYEAKCRSDQNEKDCREFVGLFQKLAVRNDCKRRFDTEAVPSVWICDEDAEESAFPKLFERSATTLSKLKYPFARKFYGSEAFRSTLDGETAAEHFEQSKKTNN